MRPIALRQVMEIAKACDGLSISGMGGIETGYDAAQFILLGSHTIQVCTGAMLRGYEVITELKDQLLDFMNSHNFERIDDFVGKSLPYFSTHANLSDRQREAKVERAGQRNRDNDWKGEIAKETENLTVTE